MNWTRRVCSTPQTVFSRNNLLLNHLATISVADRLFLELLVGGKYLKLDDLRSFFEKFTGGNFMKFFDFQNISKNFCCNSYRKNYEIFRFLQFISDVFLKLYEFCYVYKGTLKAATSNY